jgi:hypothetical protein
LNQDGGIVENARQPAVRYTAFSPFSLFCPHPGSDFVFLTPPSFTPHTQLSAVEIIFVEAMAAQGIDDLQGDNGLQCIQQLLEEYELKKEEASALQQLLADSNSQIQAARARTLQLQETLVYDDKGPERGG